jgi:hypothetical protein
MDITGIDIAACGTMIGTIVTSFGALKKTASTEALMKQQKELYEDGLADIRERMALQEKQSAMSEKRFDECNRDFERIDNKLDKTNDLLHTLIGFVQGQKGHPGKTEGGLGL